MIKLAFLIIAHKNYDSVLRLVKVLKHSNTKHNMVEVFIHFDASKRLSSKDIQVVNSIAHVIPDPMHCELDDRSIVEAEIKTIKYAKEYSSFDYFALLSGQDYPLRRIDDLIAFLDSNQPKSFIDVVPYKWNNFVWFKFKASPWYKTIHKAINNRIKSRTVARLLKIPIFALDMIVTRHNRTLNRQIKNAAIIPYGGCQWWILHKEAIEELLFFVKTKSELYNSMLNKLFTPEDTIIQTALMNSEYKKTSLSTI